MARMNLVQRHADHHGGTRPLSDLTAIVLHETEGFNSGDYSTLKAGGPHNVSVHFWVPDYDDGAVAARWLTPDGGTVVQFLPLNVAGNSVGTAKPGFSNAKTVSIELGNYNTEAYGALQLEVLDQLIAFIDAQLGRALPILSHAEIALPRGRKTDPGRTFPMAAYKAYRRHVAVTTPTTPPVTPPPVKPPAPKPAGPPVPWSGGVVRNTLRARLCRDNRVLRWQVQMRERGWDIACDGKFGPASAKVAHDFQVEKHLIVDGALGPQTYNAAWTAKIT